MSNPANFSTILFLDYKGCIISRTLTETFQFHLARFGVETSFLQDIPGYLAILYRSG